MRVINALLAIAASHIQFGMALQIIEMKEIDLLLFY